MRLCDIRVLDDVDNHNNHCVIKCSVFMKGYVNSNHNYDVNTDVHSYVCLMMPSWIIIMTLVLNCRIFCYGLNTVLYHRAVVLIV
jgi:hypothetical protein